MSALRELNHGKDSIVFQSPKQERDDDIAKRSFDAVHIEVRGVEHHDEDAALVLRQIASPEATEGWNEGLISAMRALQSQAVALHDPKIKLEVGLNLKLFGAHLIRMAGIKTYAKQADPLRERCKIELKRKGWSYRSAAHALGIHHVHLAMVLTGKRDSMRLMRAIMAMPDSGRKWNRKLNKDATPTGTP